MQIPPTRFGLAWVLAGAVLVGGLVPLGELMGTALLVTMLPFVGLAAVASLLVNVVRLVPRGSRRRAALWVLISATALASLFAGFTVRWPIRRFMFDRLAQRFEPLVQAVERFEREQGRPPATLDEVVPAWIGELPSTQMIGCTRVEYTVLDEPNVMNVSRYDLGSISQRPSRWLPPDAEAREASSLIVAFGQSGTVQYVETDGIAWKGPKQAFEAKAWRDKRDRPALARQVEDTRLLGRKTRAEVEALLGPPDEQWRLMRGAWEIRIPCGSGGMNWDSFFYWPGHAYPSSGFGGGVERIGAWAYVHE